MWNLQIILDGCEICETCRYPQHEEEVGELAREMGFTHVSLSSAIMPMARIVPRGFTGHFYHNYCRQLNSQRAFITYLLTYCDFL